MRKLLRGIALVLLAAILMSVYGCAALFVQEEEYSFSVLAADEDVRHETGGPSGDGGWGAGIDSVRYELARVNGLSLKKGSYLLTIQTLTDNNADLADLIGELYVYRSGTDKVIETRALATAEFEYTFTYQDVLLPFTLDSREAVDIVLVTRSNSYMRVREIAVKSIIPGSYTKSVPDVLFAGKEEEASMQYDENVVYYFDAKTIVDEVYDYHLAYDILSTVAVLQGIVNREEPRLYVRATGYPSEMNNAVYDPDLFWLDYIKEETDILEGKELVEVENYFTLMRLFRSFVKGIVVWDIEVPATVNAAYTTCGVYDYLPLSSRKGDGSMYKFLVEEEKLFAVKLDFTDKFTGNGTIWDTDLPSTGSAKNDVYHWAKVKFLDTELCNPNYLSIYQDTFLGADSDYYPELLSYPYYRQIYLRSTGIRDYFIAKKAFFIDLSPWAEFIPNDDPGQKLGEDQRTFHMILGEMNRQNGGTVIKVGGFVPWMTKYTKFPVSADPNSPDSVPSEWKMITELSYYMGVSEADGDYSTCNSSFFMTLETRESYRNAKQRIDPSGTAEQIQAYESEVAKYIGPDGKVIPNNYIMMYMGDYDSVSWLHRHMPAAYDETRGKYPLAWPIGPGLGERVPYIYDYMYDNATANDYFVAGDNGIGYLDPFALVSDDRPENAMGTLDDWAEINKAAYAKYNLQHQGFLIPTSMAVSEENQRLVCEAYAKIGVKGMSAAQMSLTYYRSETTGEAGYAITSYIDVGIAFSGAQDLFLNSTQDITDDSEPNFLMVRSVIGSAEQANGFLDTLITYFPNRRVVPLDPYTFYELARIAQLQKQGGTQA